MQNEEQKETKYIPREITEVKSVYKKEGGGKSNYEETVKVKEDPTSTSKIVKRVIISEQPITQTTYYEKRVIKATTPSKIGEQNINSRYANIKKLILVVVKRM